MDNFEYKRNLEERSYEFAKRCRDFCRRLPKTAANYEYVRQLIRSSGSQAANYIESGECISRKDSILRIRICRKETKESALWLRLCETENNEVLDQERSALLKESWELRCIYSAILEKITVPCNK